MEPARTSSRLRAAIAAGDWVGAESSLIEFRHEVEMAWTAAATEEDRSAIQQHVHEILEWSRNTTLAVRSHDHQNLLRLIRGGAYAEAQPVPETFTVDV